MGGRSISSIANSNNTASIQQTTIERFIVFESQCREEMQKDSRIDRELYILKNGYYNGDFEPERIFVIKIKAFAHEYDLDFIFDENIPEDASAFERYYKKFTSDLTYYKTRLHLKKDKGDVASIATPLKLLEDYKSEIHSNLNTIRKIVDAHVSDLNKKDDIYKKIALLQLEIDRDRTTVDAVFGRVIDLSKVLGDAGKNLEPAVEKLERVMKALKDGSEILKLIPSKKHKQIEDKREEIDALDDEIPF